jgi:LPS-assembly lipoprotein
LLAAAGLFAVAPLLSACGFQPLYGTTSVTGSNLSGLMAAVDIAPIPGRVGQEVRNELIFKTTGGDLPAEPEYRLEIAMRESAQPLLVELDGDAKGLLFAIDADFRLIKISSKEVLLTAKASSRAAYQKVESIFANLRARKDAEDRAARELADGIRTRVAAFLSSTA